MKIKKFLALLLFGLIWLGSAFAIIQPNIVSWWSTVTSIDPTLYYMIVQSWTTQRNILVSNVANSISGLMLDKYRTWVAPLLTPLQAGAVSFQVGLSASVTATWGIAIGNEWATAAAFDCLATQGSLCQWYNSISMWDSSQAIETWSVAIWYQAISYSEDAFAMWYWAHASGFSSLALWANTNTKAAYSVAGWFGSVANAEWAVARWLSLTGNATYWRNIWFRNLGWIDSVFEVGIGTNTTWANAFTVWNTGSIYFNQLTNYTCLATDASGMIINQACVTGSYIPWAAVDTWRNNTGSDTIIPTEKLVYSLVSWLTTTYIPFRSGDKFYDTNTVYSWAKLGIGTTTPWYTLELSWDMFVSQWATQVGWFLLDVLGHRVGLYWWIVGMTTWASVYGQTDVGIAWHFESLWAGTWLDVVSLSWVGATIQGATTGLIVYWKISAMSWIYDSAGVSYITGWALELYDTWGYHYYNGRSNAPITWDWRQGISGNTLSAQMLTGWVWVQAWYYSVP